MEGRGREPGLRLLGPVVLEGADGPVTTASSMLRTLIALLAIRPGEVVGVVSLIDELWGESLPQDPRAALQVQITRLRAWLVQAGIDRSALRYGNRGYVLAIDRSRIDLARFDQAARAAVAATEPEDVVSASDAALAEWRDDPFGGCLMGLMLEAEQFRQRELHLRVIVRRAEALLALDRHADVIVDLAAPRRRNLERERLTELTAIALYRAGRQQEALAACAETRRHLAEEYGLSPTSALERLEQQILQEDPSLLADRRQRPSERGRGTQDARPVWSPLGVGAVSDREVVEALRLSDHLGRWVEALADDDRRLPEAEATRNALDAELRLSSPRRHMLRAIVQSGLDLLHSDIQRFTGELADLLEVDLSDRAPVAPPDGAALTDGSGPAADAAWAASSETVTALAERAADLLPPDGSAPPDGITPAPTPDDEAPGRGTVLVRFGRWAGKEGGSALVRGGAIGSIVLAGPWLGKLPPAAVRLIESLLNLVGI